MQVFDKFLETRWISTSPRIVVVLEELDRT